MNEKLKLTFCFWILMVILSALIIITPSPVSAQTTCPDLGSTFGSANYTLPSATAGSHRVWLRLKSPDGTATIKYSVSGGGTQCNQTVSTTGATNWKWVQSSAQFSTTGGNLSMQLAGTKAGVGVDCFVLTTDASFSPTTAADCSGPTVPNLPNVNIVPGSLVTIPAAPKAGDEVSFQVTIRNDGTGATPNNVIHGVAFVINGANVAWSDNSTASLAPGATRVLTTNGGPDGNATWTATAGSIPVTARWDDVLRITESDNIKDTEDRTVTVTTGPVDPIPPTSTITTPPTGVVDGNNFTINVNATDNVAIARVAIEVVGGAELVSDNTAPYSPAVNTRALANGNYQLRAVAYDTAGNRTNSSPVTLKVRLVDINRSGTVEIGDLTAVISSWNQNNPAVPTNPAYDLDDDGVIGIGDLTKLISRWGM